MVRDGSSSMYKQNKMRMQHTYMEEIKMKVDNNTQVKWYIQSSDTQSNPIHSIPLIIFILAHSVTWYIGSELSE